MSGGLKFHANNDYCYWYSMKQALLLHVCRVIPQVSLIVLTVIFFASFFLISSERHFPVSKVSIRR